MATIQVITLLMLQTLLLLNILTLMIIQPLLQVYECDCVKLPDQQTALSQVNARTQH